MSATAISLVSLTKTYGAHKAVDTLSLTVASGSIYALLGPNGAGKTTTIQMLLGFLAPDSGTIHVAGHDVLRHAVKARAATAYIPEQVQLYPQLSGYENLDYFSRLAGYRLVPATLNEMLERVGLGVEKGRVRAEAYSKGMRQKVGIAIALAKRAQVLLLDEPTSGLDPHATAQFNALMKQVASEGVAILMATHDLFHVHQVATHWGVLVSGQLVTERQSAHNMSLAEIESVYLSLIEPAGREVA